VHSTTEPPLPPCRPSFPGLAPLWPQPQAAVFLSGSLTTCCLEPQWTPQSVCFGMAEGPTRPLHGLLLQVSGSSCSHTVSPNADALLQFFTSLSKSQKCNSRLLFSTFSESTGLNARPGTKAPQQEAEGTAQLGQCLIKTNVEIMYSIPSAMNYEKSETERRIF
jgi:hypothetical protein